MANLAQVAKAPALGSAGWQLLSNLSGGKGAQGFSLGSLRPEQYGMSQEDMLNLLHQYDPNAQFTEWNYGNEGGNTTTEAGLQFDVSKLPAEFQKAAVKPGAVNTNVVGVKLDQTGKGYETGDLFNPNAVKFDPLFGYYTPTQNSKNRMIDSKEGPIALAVAGMLLTGGLGLAGMGLTPMQSLGLGLPNAAGGAAKGSYGGIGGIAGGLLGSYAGIPYGLGGTAGSLAGSALNKGGFKLDPFSLATNLASLAGGKMGLPSWLTGNIGPAVNIVRRIKG